LWPLVLKIFFAKFACFPIWSATWDELRFWKRRAHYHLSPTNHT
jgi:hypothetical protein